MSAPQITRILGRALVGAAIGNLGRGAFQKPAGPTKTAAPTLAALREVVPLPFSDETAVRLNAGAQMAAGAMLVLGVKPRLAAVTLLGTLIPTTIAGHDFWKHEAGSPEHAAQTIQFQKNLAMAGALVVIAGDRRSRAR